ncbi:MAG: 50S ribosomal protein L18 [Thermonemataceae bacterium]
MATSNKVKRRLRIKKGIRKQVHGTSERPRLSVFRSNTRIYAQIINDDEGKTLASASSVEVSEKVSIEVAKEVGKKLAEKALAADVKQIVFDRNGYLYHGKVKSLAEGAREGGLQF